MYRAAKSNTGPTSIYPY